jgi:2-keto-4-pentenoate hydratase
MLSLLKLCLLNIPCTLMAKSIAISLIDARSFDVSLSTDVMTTLSTIGITDGLIIQQDIVINLAESKIFGEQVGWKCGATNQNAQDALNCPEPFYGPLYSHHIHNSPGNIIIRKEKRIVAVEAEYCLIMNEDCPAKSTPYTVEEIWERVRYVVPSIEIAATRLTGKYSAGAIIADFAWNDAVILGERIPKLLVSPTILMESEASLVVDGSKISSALGSYVLDGPVQSATWLANELIRSSAYLRAGDIIMTGAACVYKDLKFDDHIIASFDKLSPEVSIVEMFVTSEIE